MGVFPWHKEVTIEDTNSALSLGLKCKCKLSDFWCSQRPNIHSVHWDGGWQSQAFGYEYVCVFCNYQSERRYQSQPGSWPCLWGLGPGNNGGRWAAWSLTAGWGCREPTQKSNTHKLRWYARYMEDRIYRERACGLTVVPSKRSKMKVMALLLMPMKRLIHDKET